MSIRPVGARLGAEVSGINLAQPLNDDQRNEIVAAIDEHAVLVFRQQPLTEDQQIELT
ncbi:TauD/TfdA dioxygenase family protein, partial [Burkholderia sp. PU8-34]